MMAIESWVAMPAVSAASRSGLNASLSLLNASATYPHLPGIDTENGMY
jgi:hypothetical protein